MEGVVWGLMLTALAGLAAATAFGDDAESADGSDSGDEDSGMETESAAEDSDTEVSSARGEDERETEGEVSPKLKDALHNITGLARALRAAEKRNSELQSQLEARESPSEAADGLAEDGLPADLRRDWDEDGQPLVEIYGEWVSPEMARELLAARQWRESQAAGYADQEAAEVAAALETAQGNLVRGVQGVVETIMTEEFPELSGEAREDVEDSLVGIADKLIAAAAKEASAQDVPVLELFFDAGFLDRVARQVQERARRAFGAYYEQQVRHNREYAQRHPVTTPTGATAVEPRLTWEEFEALPAGRKRELMGQVSRKR